MCIPGNKYQNPFIIFFMGIFLVLSSGCGSPSTSTSALSSPAIQHLYVAQSGSVGILSLTASGNVAPDASITGANTELNDVLNIAFDSHGNIYVVNDGAGLPGGYVTVYAAGSSGNAAPTGTIPTGGIIGSNTGLNGPSGIALGPDDKIYVTNSNGNTITVYSPGASGNVTPLATISGAATGLNDPLAIAVDTSGKIFVANGLSDSLTVYAAGANGNVAPIAIISGSNTGLSNPNGLFVDPRDNIYVANFDDNSVTIYAAGSSGNAMPTATIGGSNTGLLSPWGVALDTKGNIYVSNNTPPSILVYAAGTDGNVAPAATIISTDGRFATLRGVAVH